MKKLIVIATILMMVPFTAFSLESLNDSSMDDVTGQAGVSLGMDGTMEAVVTIESFTYTDEGSLAVSNANGGDLLELTTTVTGVIDIDVEDAPATLPTMTGTVIKVGLANATVTVDPIVLANTMDIALGGSSLGTIGLGSIGIDVTLPSAMYIGTH